MDDWIEDDDDRAAAHHLEPHQVKAAAAPHLSITELAQGSFKDLESLFEQLGDAPVIELGKPAPEDRYLPKPRAGGCPSSHNRALLGGDDL